MSVPKLLTTLGVVLALVALFIGAGEVHGRALALRDAASEIDAHVVVPAPQAARILSFGENELAADLTWVRTLVYYGDGLIHHTGMPDVEQLIALINNLDPHFRRPYLWGAYSTTFRDREATQAEYRSSVEILRRGVTRFPDDWQLSWLLGLRLFYDVRPTDPREVDRQREEGAYYIERAMRLPGSPPDLPIIAASMRSKLGQTERGLHELREMILTTEDKKARAELQLRYDEMASAGAGADLAAEAAAFDAAWKQALPYAPSSLFVIVGPAPAVSLDPETLSLSWRGPFLSQEDAIAPPAPASQP